GSNNADLLEGGRGDDLLEGRGGNDTLDGGLGRDLIRGGPGNDRLYTEFSDTLLFSVGDGQDTLIGSDVGKLAFDADVRPDQIVLNFTGTQDDRFRIEYGTGDHISATDHMRARSIWGVSVNGFEVPLTQRSDLVDGTFYGTYWDDVFETGNGNDTIYFFDWGDDVIRIAAGGGQDKVLIDYGSSPTEMGEIRLASDVDLSSLTYSFLNGTATIHYGDGDELILEPDGVFSMRDHALARFTLVSEADPNWTPEITGAGVSPVISGTFGADRLFSEGSSMIVPSYGNDVIEGGPNFDQIVLNDVYVRGNPTIGQKQINAGAGDDVIFTPLYQGTQIYYNRGDGHDTISYDWSYSLSHPYFLGPDIEKNEVVFQAGGRDALVFGPGIALSDLEFVRLGEDLDISLADGSGGLRLRDYFLAYDVNPEPWQGDVIYLFNGDSQIVPDSLLHPAILAVLPDNPISELRFADGSVFEMSAVLAALLEVYEATILGTEGKDTLVATGEDDVIHALGGDDFIQALEGNNTVLAGAGDDQILAAGTNTIDPGPGDDWISMIYGDQRFHFGPGSDSNLLINMVQRSTTIIEMAEGLTPEDIEVSVVDGEWGEVPLITLAATGDTLQIHPLQTSSDGESVEVVPNSDAVSVLFSNGSSLSLSELFALAENTGETISGTDGADNLVGTAGDDVLTGGRGNDTMEGGSGDDVFMFEGARTGKNRVIGGAGFDIVLGGVDNDRIRLTELKQVDGLERIDGGLGTNTLQGTGGKNTLDFSATELVNIASIDGRGGRDVITGSEGDDVIIGGRGKDVLSGGNGDDTYLYALGDGRDVIRNSDQNADSFDSLIVEGLEHDQLWLSRKRDDLVIDIEGSNGRVVIEDWYTHESSQLDALYAGSHALMRNQVDQLVNAMAGFEAPAGADTFIPDAVRTELKPVLAAVWQSSS
ncbi:MAG: hypothetical protein AAF699_10820, partial [Pseudomonadota bacterium]